ncbi:MAG TPA: NAD-dependent epimerase/dehydratase family protein [Jatrophihabitantaceae bacterium]|jgi:uncharacterized protein YbjT (DUF2867 family)
MKIVVIGGTGLIGGKVVQNLTSRGHEAAAASPKTRVNTITASADARLGTTTFAECLGHNHK